MALGTYSGLKTAIVDFSGRDDLTSLLDDFIDLAEQEIYYNDEMPLRVRQMDTRSTLTGTSGSRFLALPADFLEPRALLIIDSGERRELIFNSPSALKIDSTDGSPIYYTLTSQIEFDRELDSAYSFELQYYGKPTALSSANPTNDILTNFPKVYLNGCLSAVYDYVSEDERAERYHQKMIRSIKGAIKGDRTGRYGPAPTAKVNGSKP